ncbi:hypothetical protein STXM2123_1493 [Streptomyces sp. F-3]|nr:hypothetical protein STXM2123_1493 [Streptomyces sp. F-3]
MPVQVQDTAQHSPGAGRQKGPFRHRPPLFADIDSMAGHRSSAGLRLKVRWKYIDWK